MVFDQAHFHTGHLGQDPAESTTGAQDNAPTTTPDGNEVLATATSSPVLTGKTLLMAAVTAILVYVVLRRVLKTRRQ